MGTSPFIPYFSVRCDFQGSNPNDTVGLSLCVRVCVCVCVCACVGGGSCVRDRKYLCMDLNKSMLYICIYTCDYMEYNPTYVQVYRKRWTGFETAIT